MNVNREPDAESLWNPDVTPDTYGSSEQYYKHVFKQYAICVEMADRVSSRRNLANTFFLTLNTFILGAAGFLYEKGPSDVDIWFLLIPLAVLLANCYVWWRLLLSYRQLNKAKFAVIGEYEKRLPTGPFVAAEWKLLGEGADPSLYRPLSDVEKWIPILFAAIYVAGAALMVLV
jgi:hypothetical protein